MKFFFNNKENENAITLITLIISIIIIIILSIISIWPIYNNRILNKSFQGINSYVYQGAIEEVKFIITVYFTEYNNIECDKSLFQYVTDKLCEDENVQYVIKSKNDEKRKEKIDVTYSSQIYVKLKKYSYQFEIDDELNIISIDDSIILIRNKVITDRLREFIEKSDVIIDLPDIITDEFIEKFEDNEKLARIITSNKEYLQIISSTNNAKKIFQKLDLSLIPEKNNNSNLIYSSQYDSNSYAAYRAFNKSSYWCTANSQVTGSFLGYDFNDKIYIKFIQFSNGSDRNVYL